MTEADEFVPFDVGDRPERHRGDVASNELDAETASIDEVLRSPGGRPLPAARLERLAA